MKKFLLFTWIWVQAGCINQTLLPAADPLPSWNNTIVKEAIIRYVQQISDPHSFLYTPIDDRIAVFDFDGTIITEKPDYLQKVYSERFPMIISVPGDYDSTVKVWFDKAKHPRFNRLYKNCLYQPMLELMKFFEAYQIRNFICSGSDMDFLRIVAGGCSVPPERIIGTSYHTSFDTVRRSIIRSGEMDASCWKSGKPESIYRHIGKKPLIVIGNADGDIRMLEYTSTNKRPTLRMLLVHDDATREYAYTEGAKEALLRANQEHWIRISMKDDFKVIYPEASGGEENKEKATVVP